MSQRTTTWEIRAVDNLPEVIARLQKITDLIAQQRQEGANSSSAINQQLAQLKSAYDTLQKSMQGVSDEQKKQVVASAAQRAETEKLHQSIDTLRSSGSALVGIMASIFTASRVREFAVEMVGAEAKVALFSKSLATILQNKQQADQIAKYALDMAARSPFQVGQIIEVTQRLAAMGAEGSKITTYLEALGEISAVVGMQKLPLIAKALLDVQNKQILYAQEVRQFTDNGVPLYQLLADSMDLPIKKVKQLVDDHKIGFKEVEKALLEATQVGGKYHGMMAMQAETNAGKLSNLTDAVFLAKARLGEMYKDGISKVIDGMKSMLEWLTGGRAEMERTGNIVKAVTAALVTYVATTRAAGVAIAAKEVIMRALNLATGTYNLMMITATGTTTGFTQAQLASAVAARSTWAVLAANPIGAVITLVGAAVSAYYAWSAATEKVNIGISENESKLRSEQSLLQVHFEAAMKSKEGTTMRANAIDFLVKKYPELFRGIDTETIGNEQLRRKLAEVNLEYDRKIVLARKAYQMEVLAKEQKNLFEQEMELMNKLQEKMGPEFVSKVGGSARGFVAAIKEMDNETKNKVNNISMLDLMLGRGNLTEQARFIDLSLDVVKTKMVATEKEMYEVDKTLTKNKEAEAKASLDNIEKHAKVKALSIKDAWLDAVGAYPQAMAGVTNIVREEYEKQAKFIKENYSNVAVQNQKLKELAQEYASTQMKIVGDVLTKQLESYERDVDQKQASEDKKARAEAEAFDKKKGLLTQEDEVETEAERKKRERADKEKALVAQSIALFGGLIVADANWADSQNYNSKKRQENLADERDKLAAINNILSTVTGLNIENLNRAADGLSAILNAGGISGAIQGAKTKDELQNITHAVGIIVEATHEAIKAIGKLVISSFDFGENIQRAIDSVANFNKYMIDSNNATLDAIYADTSRSYAEREQLAKEFSQRNDEILYGNERAQIELNSIKNSVEMQRWHMEQTMGFIENTFRGPKGWIENAKMAFTYNREMAKKEAEMMVQEEAFKQQLVIQTAQTKIDRAKIATDAQIAELERERDAAIATEKAKNDTIKNELDVLDTKRNQLLDQWLARRLKDLEDDKNLALQYAQTEEEKSNILIKYQGLVSDAHKTYEDAKLDKTKAVSLATTELKDQESDYVKNKESETTNAIKAAKNDMVSAIKAANQEIYNANKAILIAELKGEIAKLKAKRWFLNAGKIDAAIDQIEGIIAGLDSGNTGNAVDGNMGLNENIVIAAESIKGIENAVKQSVATIVESYYKAQQTTQQPVPTQNKAGFVAVQRIVESYENDPNKYANAPNIQGDDGHEKPMAQALLPDGSTTLAYEWLWDGGQVLWRTAPKFKEGVNYLDRGINPLGTDTIPAWLNEGERVMPTWLNELIGGKRTTNEELAAKSLLMDSILERVESSKNKPSSFLLPLPDVMLSGRSGGSTELAELADKIVEAINKPHISINVRPHSMSVAETNRYKQHVTYYQNTPYQHG